MDQPELYSESSGCTGKDTIEILNKFKNSINWDNNERILDIGCGPGNSTKLLLFPLIPKTAQLVGVDISENMIRHAQEKYGDNDRLTFIKVDFVAKNAKEILGYSSFNKVFSFYCLHWIKDQRQSVENIYNVLKPEGMALLTLVSWCPVYEIYKLICKVDKWKSFMQDMDNYITPYQNVENPSKQYRKLLEDTGFRVIECYDKESPFYFSSVDMLKKFLISLNPFVKRMSPSQQVEYIECMVNLFEEQNFIRLKKNRSGEEESTMLKPNRVIIALCQKNEK